MSLSISQQNSYLKKPLGQRTESNQNAGSSRTQVAQNLQSGSAGATRTATLSPKKHSRFVAGQGNLDSRAARRSTARLQDVNKRPTQGYYDTSRNDYFTKQTSSDRSIWTQSQGYSNFNFGQMTGTNMFGMNGMNGMNQTGAMGMLNKIGGQLGIDAGTINTVGAIYNGVQQVGNIFGINPTQQLGSVLGSFGGSHSTSSAVSSSANAAITSMTSANDSATLRQSIVLAEEQEAALNSQLTADGTTYEQKVTTLKADISTKKAAVSNQQKAATAAKQELTNAKNTVTTLTTQRDAKKGALQKAMTQKNQCSAAFAQAHANTVAAQQAFDSTPPDIDGPNGTKIPNPAKDTAKKALEAAQKAEEQAKTDLDKANEAAITADKEVQNAEKELKDAQSQLDKAQTTLDEKQKAYQEAQVNLQKAEDELENVEDALNDLNQAKQDYDKLKQEITSQKSRLAQLETQEEKEFNANNSKIDKKTANIDKRSQKINPKDGMSISEQIRQAKNENDQEEIDKLNAKNALLQDNRVKTKCLQGPSEEGKDGVALRSCDLPSGKKAYFVGMKEVSEEEYNSYKTTPQS